MIYLKRFLFCLFWLWLVTPSWPEDLQSILTKKTGWWGPGGGASNWNWGYEFQKGGQVKYIFAGEGSHEVDGRYSIERDQILISLNKPSYDFKIALKNTCSVVSTPNELVFQKKLACTDKKEYFGYGHISLDEKKSIQGNAVITTGRKRGIITADVKYRIKPSKTAATIDCKQTRKQLKDSGSLAKDSIVHVYARTEQKETVDKWSNYWYYIAPMYDMHDGESCKADFGWIFAEFVEWDKYQDN